MKKPLLILALVSTVGYGAYRVLGSDSAPIRTATDSDQLALDRIWIDHMPRNDKDVVNVFVAITDQPFGAFQASSSWKGQYELFQYTATGNELRIVYPQSGERDTVKHKARRCTDKQMDFCLELDGGSRGVKRYYSREGWEVDGVTSPAELRARTEARVDALVSAPR